MSKGLYLGNAEYLLSDQLFLEDVRETADSSYNSPHNTRTFSQTYEHTLSGLLGEKLFIDHNEGYTKYVGQGQNKYIYDVTGNYSEKLQHNLKIEVKTTKQDTNWWNISPKTIQGEIVPSYLFFLQNANKIDLIVNLYITPEYDVYLKYIAKADTFERYMTKSNGNGWYYNHKQAYKSNQCKVLT